MSLQNEFMMKLLKLVSDVELQSVIKRLSLPPPHEYFPPELYWSSTQR